MSPGTLAAAAMPVGPDMRVAVVAALCAAAVGGVSVVVSRLLRLSLRGNLALLVLTSVLAVAVGTVMASREMYLESAELRVVLLVCAVCGGVAIAVGLLHARRLVLEARTVRNLAAALAHAATNPPEAPARRPRTTELAEISDELVQTGHRLAEAAARERALESSRRDLVAWVSHDLRTPLAGLRALVEALEDGVADNPDAYLKRIGVEVDRLGEMVSDLFELSRLQAGGGVRRTEPVLVHDLVSDTLAGIEALARARGVLVDGSSPAAVRVAADPSALLRALENLTSNGVRHTAAGGTVGVAARTDGGEVLIEVTDGCGGIPADVLPRVFEVGFRGSKARTPGVDGGAGLGLAIVAGIAEAHSGRVEAENSGPGCTFRLRLPVYDG